MSFPLLIYGVPFSSALNPERLGATNWWATRKSYIPQGNGTLILPDNIGGLALSSATVQKTPTVQTGVNGIKMLTFDGSSNNLQTVTTTMSQPVFIISVIRVLADNITNAAIFDGMSSTNMLFDLSPNTLTFRMFSGDTLNATNNVTGSLVIFSNYYSGASSKLWINGVQQATTGSTASNNPNGLSVGSRGSGTNCSKINYYESILFRTNITRDVHNAVGTSLSQIYGINWTSV